MTCPRPHRSRARRARAGRAASRAAGRTTRCRETCWTSGSARSRCRSRAMLELALGQPDAVPVYRARPELPVVIIDVQIAIAVRIGLARQPDLVAILGDVRLQIR